MRRLQGGAMRKTGASLGKAPDDWARVTVFAGDGRSSHAARMRRPADGGARWAWAIQSIERRNTYLRTPSLRWRMAGDVY